LFYTDPADKSSNPAVQYRGKIYDIPDLTVGDANVFKIFNYKFLEGNPDSCLVKPGSMVISEKIKHEIFGNTPALGKKVKTSTRTYTISGVFSEKGKPSHLNFDGILSVSSLSKDAQNNLKSNWATITSYTYVKISDTTNLASFQQRANFYVDSVMKSYVKKQKIKLTIKTSLNFQPIQNVHFTTGMLYDYYSNIKPSYLYILGIVAFFILLTASINYINFATAQSIKKARQIGIRKVLGADRKQLLRQYISESLILTFVSFLIALSIVEMLMPVFNDMVGKNIVLIKSLINGNGIFFGLLLLLVISMLAILSGSFPAIVLYVMKPVNALRGNKTVLRTKTRKQAYTAASLRKALVIFQYFAGIGVLSFTWIMEAQIHFVENRGLGFDKNDIIVVTNPPDTAFWKQAPLFVNDLKKDNAIEQASVAINMPGYNVGKTIVDMADTSSRQTQLINSYFIGNNYFNLLRIKLAQGRKFNASNKGDTTANVILNESAVKFLHLKNPIGKTIKTEMSNQKGKVIGVVKDFNYSALYRPVEPLVFFLRNNISRFVIFRYKPGMKDQAISYLQEVWKKYNKNYTLYYTFLDKKLDSLYQKDEKMFYLFIYFSIFVIFISSIGLYGLSAFLIEQRSREISIRKVLGGSKNQLLVLLSKEYLALVLFAGAVVSPLVYFFTRNWLESFAYHINISIFYFLFSILFVCLISFLTVLIQSYRILRKSPSEYLKYE
jgi:putative ABC transport system permease protein